MIKKMIPYILVPFGLIVGQSGANRTSVNTNQVKIVSNLPAQTVTVFQAGMANSFPLPPKTSVCIVSRNISQSIGIDYTIINSTIVFNDPPLVGDVIQLNCW